MLILISGARSGRIRLNDWAAWQRHFYCRLRPTYSRRNRLTVKRGNYKVFYYYFDQHPDYPADSPQAGRGSPHGQKASYVFQHLNPNQKPSKSDEAISETMAAYQTSFAKFGDPNGPGIPKWPAFNDANPVLMYFSQTAHTRPVPSADALKVMDQYFAWRRTPEGEAFVK
jgi:para-nitrobenzyl esterase